MNKRAAIVTGVLFAAILACAFYRATFTNFYYVRYKLVDAVRTPDSDGALLVTVPSDADMTHCRVFVIKVNNTGIEETSFTFYVNEAVVARASVEANESRKLFLKILPFAVQGQNHFEIRASGTTWSVEDWELRNVYKFYRGLFTWIVIDGHFKQYETILLAPALLALVLFFVALLRYPARGALLYFHLLVILLFAALILLPVFSQYRVLISIKSFLLVVFLFLLPALRGTYRLALSKAGTSAESLRIGVVVAAIVLFYFLCMRYALWEYKGNYSGFLMLSEKFLQKNPHLRKDEELRSSLIVRKEDGYDAQFYYNIAFDPWLTYYEQKPNKYRNSIDIPVFRYRRIVYPLLAKAVSLDRAEAYPMAMILLLLCSHGVGAFLVAKIAVHFGKRVWWALLYILIPGFIVSFRYGLPESIAAALLLGGIYFYLKGRLAPAFLLFSASLLTRETGALVIAVICVFEAWKHRSWRNAILLALTVTPYLLWRLYVTWRLSPDAGWSAFFYEPGNFNMPFLGIGQLWYRVFSGQSILDGAATSIFFPLLLIVIFLSSIWILQRRKDFLTVSLVLYSFLAVSLNHDTVWVGVVNAERQSYECFMVLLLIFLSAKSYSAVARILPIFVFLLVFIYDWCCLTAAQTFHAGLLFLN